MTVKPKLVSAYKGSSIVSNATKNAHIKANLEKALQKSYNRYEDEEKNSPLGKIYLYSIFIVIIIIIV